MNRRDFLRAAAITAGGLAIGIPALVLTAKPVAAKVSRDALTDKQILWASRYSSTGRRWSCPNDYTRIERRIVDHMINPPVLMDANGNLRALHHE